MIAQSAISPTKSEVVPNIAALDALRPSRERSLIRVLGNLSSGDWPPKDFVYQPTNTLATNAIRRATVTGVGRWVHRWDGDVRAFGAMPDDGLDDSSAISNAVVYARLSGVSVVRIPAGDFHQSSPIPIISKVTLTGAGSGKPANINSLFASTQAENFGPTRLILLNGANCSQLVLGPTNGLTLQQANDPQEDGSFENNYEYGSTVENLVIFGNSDNQTRYDCHGIKLENCWNITIKNCAILSQSGYQLWMKDCNHVLIESLYGTGGSSRKNKGIFIWGCGDTKLDNLMTGNSFGPKVWLTGSSMWQSRLQGCYLFNSSAVQYSVSSISTNTGLITLPESHSYETGMPVELFSLGGGSMCAGIQPMRPYWAIVTGTNDLKFATTLSNAILGIALIPTTVGSNLAVWHGPAAGIYANWNANNINIYGGRYDKNDYAGVVLHNTARISLTGNNITLNGIDNVATALSGVGTPVTYRTTGIELSGSANSHVIHGNVFHRLSPNFPQNFGIWVRTNTWRFNVMSETLPCQIIGNTGMSSGTNIFYDASSDRAIIGMFSEPPAVIGNTNLGNALRLYGNASEIRILRMTRSVGSSGDMSIGVTNAGLNFYDESAGATVMYLDTSGTTVDLNLGRITAPTSSSPEVARVLSESASGHTNVSGGSIEIRTGSSTGNATPAAITFQGSANLNSPGTGQQSINTLLRILAPTTPVTGDTTLMTPTYTGATLGSLRRLAVTNIAGVDYVILRP